MRLNLTAEQMFLELDPCAGGAVSTLRHRGLDVLRPAPERIGPAFDPLQYASFAMVPFVGRIHHGRFAFAGRVCALPENLPPEPHAIHGHGWRVPWKVEASDESSVSLIYHHAPDAWPWTYSTRQVFSLTPDALSVTLSLTNDSDDEMPAGLGWHPYFSRPGAVLHLPTTHQWFPDDVNGDNRPEQIAGASDLTRGRQVETLNLDTTFSVGSEPVRMVWPTHSITMRSDPVFSHATVYVPQGEDYFCVEPISHAPNAVNSALPPDLTGFRTLSPGETLSGSITLVVEH
ncbi:MAG: aldose 1-epimerase [Pseudomonadota bacterium]